MRVTRSNKKIVVLRGHPENDPRNGSNIINGSTTGAYNNRRVSGPKSVSITIRGPDVLGISLSPTKTKKITVRQLRNERGARRNELLLILRPFTRDDESANIRRDVHARVHIHDECVCSKSDEIFFVISESPIVDVGFFPYFSPPP